MTDRGMPYRLLRERKRVERSGMAPPDREPEVDGHTPEEQGETEVSHKLPSGQDKK